MSLCSPAVGRDSYRAAIAFFVVALVLASCPVGEAQQTATIGRNSAVGGVLVDPSGLLTNADLDSRGELGRMIAEVLDGIPAELEQTVGMRKVSLRRLEAAIRECAETGEELPDAVLYLAGLQQIEYVLVYPNERDIVLAGPGEGWQVGAQGAVVGATTGRPVMMLDDLMVALRSAKAPSVISCSIEPTPEGLQRLRSHARRLSAGADPRRTKMSVEQQLGPQRISVTGVPRTSHFARVMVAADYRMKRVSMGLEPAPIRGLPSFLEMVKATGRGMNNMLPRWWLAPDYQPLLRDAEGLAWQLRGGAVKAMAENDFLDAAGVKHQTGRADPVSQKWADNMTRRYEDLAAADPVFGQLRNCMDLAIVAALLVRENLPQKAGIRLPILMDGDTLQTTQLNAPKQVPSQAALVRKGRNLMIACGGVQINAWEIVERTERSDTLTSVRSNSAISDTAAWWSN